MIYLFDGHGSMTAPRRTVIHVAQGLALPDRSESLTRGIILSNVP
ncbi:MAG: hypothetical protein O3B13_26000 [Planctomycetota bacterium]|nr:hypothetical protein [Planctomycetota bacterium]